MTNTMYLEITTLEDLKDIEDDLQLLINTEIEPGSRQRVTVKFTVDFQLIVGLLGWIYSFWTFGKTFFFPDGKFRKPKLMELRRNYQIVTGVLTLKNLLVGLWKDRPATLEQIGDILKNIVPKNQFDGPS